jgi:hypothetical protein
MRRKTPARWPEAQVTAMRTNLLAVLGPLLYLLLAAALAALAAYPVFVFSGSEDISFFRTLVSRGGQALLLLGIYPLAKRLGLGWADFGWSRRFPRQWLAGFALGASMLALHVLALIALDIRLFYWPKLASMAFFSLLGQALAVGAGIAMLEESIFRGALAGVVWRLSGRLLAVLVSAFFYAALHFIGTKWSTDLALIGWDTGFRMALDGFSHLRQAPLDGFLGLFVAGLMLASVRVLIPGSLGICMGLHAGWVFIIRLAKATTLLNLDSPYIRLVSAYDTFVGYLSAAWLMLLLVLFLAAYFYLHPRGLGSQRRQLPP